MERPRSPVPSEHSHMEHVVQHFDETAPLLPASDLPAVAHNVSKEEREFEWQLRKAYKEADEAEARDKALDSAIASLPTGHAEPIRLRAANKDPSQLTKEDQLQQLRLRSTSLVQGSARRAHGIVTGRIPESLVPATVGELVVENKQAADMRREIRRLGGDEEPVGMSAGEAMLSEQDKDRGRAVFSIKKLTPSFLSGGGVPPE